MKNYYAIKRTFYLLDGSSVTWVRTKIEEENCLIDWFSAWCVYAESNGIDLNKVKHNHKVEYLYSDDE